MRGETTAASDAQATISHAANGGVRGRVSIFEPPNQQDAARADLFALVDTLLAE